MPAERDEVHPFWLRGYEAGAAEVQAELLAAQEREKALRAALEQACDDMAVMIAAVSDSLGNLQAEANLRHYRRVLAASPSEKPDG